MLFEITVGPEVDVEASPDGVDYDLIATGGRPWYVLDYPLDPARPDPQVPAFRRVAQGDGLKIPLFPYVLPAQTELSVWFGVALGMHVMAAAAAAPGFRPGHPVYLARSVPVPLDGGNVRIRIGLAIRAA